MQRLLKQFRGLRWKLTLSYTLVTVATLLVVEIFLIGAISFIVIKANILPTVLIYAVETLGQVSRLAEGLLEL